MMLILLLFTTLSFAADVDRGRELFTESCTSCHDLQKGGTDGKPISLGKRNTLTVWNAGELRNYFWDGRAKSLEEVLNDPTHKTEEIEDLAAYVRTLVRMESPYDRYMKGDKKALSKSAIRGLKLAESNGCLTCHSGPLFNGEVRPFQPFPLMPGAVDGETYDLTADLGRFEVTKNYMDRNVWRVPSLRNVELTAPYFHNGSVATLDEAVRVMARTQLNKNLSEDDVRDIVAFLQGLTGTEEKKPQRKIGSLSRCCRERF